MWIDKLKKVHELCKEYSFTCANSGAPEEIISSWAAQVQNTLGVQPPQEFIESKGLPLFRGEQYQLVCL